MQIYAYGPSGGSIPLGKAVSLRIHMDLDTPADTFQGRFLAPQKPAEIAKIQVADDTGNTLFFQGPVDEQSFEAGPQGTQLTLKARSMAALLLDNEAQPASYESPWLSTIFNNHAKPYGILSFEGSPFRGPAQFTVRRGEREWDVISGFFEKSFLDCPRVTPGNILHTSGYPIFSLPVAPIGDRSAGEPACIYIGQIQKRKEVIEKIQFISASGQLGSTVQNEAAGNGVRRRRYLMYQNSPLEYAERAYRMIDRGNRMANMLTLQCLGDPPAVAGQAIRLKDPALGTVTGYTVCRLEHCSDSAGRLTTLTCVKF